MEIKYDGTKITYLNRSSENKHNAQTYFSEKTKGNIQFVIGLLAGDSIRILD